MLVIFRRVLFLSCLVLFYSESAKAEWDYALYGEFVLNQDIGLSLDQGNGPSHGIFYLQYTKRKAFDSESWLQIGLNTDAFWLAHHYGAETRRRFQIRSYLSSQFGFGEMTPDAIFEGEHRKDQSFFSFYAEVGSELFYRIRSVLWIQTRLGLRHWLFRHNEQSKAAHFVLPENSLAIRSDLKFVWKGMKTLQKGKLKQGIHVEAALLVRKRFSNRPWGGSKSSPSSPRNAVTGSIPSVQIFVDVEAASCVGSRLCFSLQAKQGLGWMTDDLYRFKIGGDSPYIQMFSGAYFTEFVVDSFFLTHGRIFFLPMDRLRILLQVDAALLSDPNRQGLPEDAHWFVGMGFQLDFYIRPDMRLVARFGYSPNIPRPKNSGGFKLLIGFTGSWW